MTKLTPRQRILRAIKGQEVDRVPFCPFLAYYFEALDPKIQERGQLAYLEDMGADPLIRGAGFAWKKKSTRCEQKIEVKGNKRYTTLVTPYGELKTEHTYMEQGNTWFQSAYPVKTLEDIKALQAYFEDLIIEPAMDQWNQNEQAVGERALLLPLVGVDMKSSLQTLVENWMGTEQTAYMLFDYPDEMEELLAVMRQKSMRTIEYTAQSGAAAALFWEDSSTTNVSPALYEKYIEPELTAWAKVLQQSGKLLIHHACGLIHDLLPLMGRQGIAAVESLTPPPMGNVTVKEAFDLLPPEVAVIGGIDAVTLLSAPLEELEQTARAVLKAAEGHRFVLANADSCPPDVAYERFLLLSRLVREGMAS